MSVKTAFVFPGQGEEGAMMASAYLERPGPVQSLLVRVEASLSLDIRSIIRRGSPELMRAEVIQPTLTAITVGLGLELLSSGEAPSSVVGHSLGELSAAALAGCLSAEAAVDLAVRRGALMGEAARRAPGAMVAMSTKDEAVIEAALALGGEHGVVSLAARNSEEQWVLSGERRAIEAIVSRYPATRLPVSGAWHCPLMREAEEAWSRELALVEWGAVKRLWFCNRDGAAVTDNAAGVLSGQLTRPLYWTLTMRSLIESGVERLILVGPSRALRGLCRANARHAALCAATGRRELAEELRAS